MKNPHAVRETLTRRQQGFRVKFPSRKMNVMIRCESLLERDAARYLEFAPDVKTFLHNAEEFVYYDEQGVPRRYYPDFTVELIDGRQQRLEVKPKGVLCDPKRASRYALIAIRYVALGQSFRLLTDEFLHAEPLKSTLELLSRHRGQQRLLVPLAHLVALIPEGIWMSVADAAEQLGNETLVYQAIANGILYFDVDAPLGINTPVYRRGVRP